MPDLDQLLEADAGRSTASDGAPSTFAPAFDQTLTRIRRRRHGVLIGAATVVAAAVTGSLIASTTGSTQRSTESVRLAADYHVIAAVPGHSGVFYVIGPSSGHRPAECRQVPDVSIELKKLSEDAAEIVLIPARGYQAPAGIENANLTYRTSKLPSGQYDLFTCPNPVKPPAS